MYGDDAKGWFDEYDSMDDYISKGTKYSEFLCNSYQVTEQLFNNKTLFENVNYYSIFRSFPPTP